MSVCQQAIAARRKARNDIHYIKAKSADAAKRHNKLVARIQAERERQQRAKAKK